MKIVFAVPLLVLVMAGCAGPSGAPSATTSTTISTDRPSPSSTAASSATPTPATPSTQTATSAPDNEEATCENLLDDDSVERGEAEGGVISSFTIEEASEGGTLKKVLKYGGVACDFGQKQGDSPILCGYGPITEAQAAKEKAHLDKLDMPSGTNEHGGTFYGAADDTEIYVFSPKGYWAYQYNNGFGTVADIDAVEEVVANAPAFY